VKVQACPQPSPNGALISTLLNACMMYYNTLIYVIIMYPLTKPQRRIFAQREALDGVLRSLFKLEIPKPKGGWVKAIRTSLGMRVGQLGRRAKLDPTTITRLEQNEEKGTLTLQSLERLAKALDCELVYALVPRKSLDEIVKERAEKVLKKERTATKTTMELESQGSTQHVSIRDDLLTALVSSKLDKRLWEED